MCSVRVMHFGLNLPNGGASADPRTMADLAELAEQSGWDGVFLEDYIVYQNRIGTPTYDPWITLAAMATRTQRIRLGTTVTPLPRRRVAKLAAEAVTLDHLSGGRLTLGVGLGDAWDVAVANLGEPTDNRVRAAMLDEGLDVLVGLWSGEPFTYHGRFYHAQDVTLLPRPVQKPRIPIWIGGGYPNSGPVRRAARWDGSCLHSDQLLGHGFHPARLDGRRRAHISGNGCSDPAAGRRSLRHVRRRPRTTIGLGSRARHDRLPGRCGRHLVGGVDRPGRPPDYRVRYSPRTATERMITALQAVRAYDGQ